MPRKCTVIWVNLLPLTFAWLLKAIDDMSTFVTIRWWQRWIKMLTILRNSPGRGLSQTLMVSFCAVLVPNSRLQSLKPNEFSWVISVKWYPLHPFGFPCPQYVPNGSQWPNVLHPNTENPPPFFAGTSCDKSSHRGGHGPCSRGWFTWYDLGFDQQDGYRYHQAPGPHWWVHPTQQLPFVSRIAKRRVSVNIHAEERKSMTWIAHMHAYGYVIIYIIYTVLLYSG